MPVSSPSILRLNVSVSLSNVPFISTYPLFLAIRLTLTAGSLSLDFLFTNTSFAPVESVFPLKTVSPSSAIMFTVEFLTTFIPPPRVDAVLSLTEEFTKLNSLTSFNSIIPPCVVAVSDSIVVLLFDIVASVIVTLSFVLKLIRLKKFSLLEISAPDWTVTSLLF